jgi:3-hydroxy acid dehydrogenase / malonic semialdehyde reductase
MRPHHPVALISGASSGIGAATAAALAADGFHLALGARRVSRVRELAEELAAAHGVKVHAASLDVRSTGSVKSFVDGAVAALGGIHVVVNNAGLARTMDPLATIPEDAWQEMLQTNVEGVLRVTQACLPHLRAAGWGHVIFLGSTASHVAYEGGSVYCATKHAVRALTETLRLELCGEPIRVGTVDPGMVETEFSVVRLGSQEKADGVYRGVTPLRAEDIAECIRWMVSLPDHVNIDRILVKPRDQAAMHKVHRRPA